jgi:uncharacterized 2Fe-2S/4Fe-4S cluster protein (DUF4445 family)
MAMKHFRVVFKPDGREISIHQGATLLEAAGQAGIFLTAPCAGKGTCRKCTVLLHPSGQPILACQHRVEGDLTVVVPPESCFYEHKILDQGIPAGEQIHPTIYREYSDLAGTGAILGVAVDIGTTTVVAKLLDMVTGRCLATQAMLNPQTRFGDDVVSRIHYAQSEEHGRSYHIVEVHQCVDKVLADRGADASSIYEASIVGNTTIEPHLPAAPGRTAWRARTGLVGGCSRRPRLNWRSR